MILTHRVILLATAVLVSACSSSLTQSEQSAPTVLSVAPGDGLAAIGSPGGPFTDGSKSYVLTNTGDSSLDWTASKTADWLTLSASSGTLAAGASETVVVAIAVEASRNLPTGVARGQIHFTDETRGQTVSRSAQVSIEPSSGSFAIEPRESFATTGPVGGPFSPQALTYTIRSTASTPVTWTCSASAAWVALSASSGTLAVGASQDVTVSIVDSATSSLPPGSHAAELRFEGGSAAVVRGVTLTVTDGSTGGTVAGLFVTRSDLTRAIARGAATTQPFRTSHDNLIRLADGLLSVAADPFTMPNMTRPVSSGGIVMHWNGSSDGADNSLRDAVDDLSDGGDDIQTLALAFALTGDRRYGDKAVMLMRTWAAEHTPVNMYDFRIDFVNATFDGMIDGWQDGRPWNFALDTVWQTYGLIQICDGFLLLELNGYGLTPSDRTTWLGWIRTCAEAVNSGFHAWTRWADAHPTSSSFTRYRSDNHLSWALAGLAAASVAMDDQALADYVLRGGAWTDSRAGSYANPSHIRDVIDRAIESDGRVYEELIRRVPPIGYSFFHLWPMTFVARIAEVHHGEDVWSFRGADGGGLEKAFDRYAGYILGTRTSPNPSVEGDLTASYGWLFEMPWVRWGKADARACIERTTRLTRIKQGIGPVALLLGGDLP